ncbi:MAG TPA: ABC transporter ATP-binding protein [Allosphingosinicella sp.]|jgi:iron complex transport system ATP-binding protein
MTMLVQADALALAGRLEPTDLGLAAGELCCLVGPNGSGKTSLLHALAGIERPDGAVRIDGIDPHAVAPAMRQRLLSYLPASRDIAWPLLASDLIRLGSEASELAIDGLLDALELRAILHRRTDQLSTGERSRVLIARTLAPRPRLLLLDEPVSNLDPRWQLRLLDLVRSEARRNGQAVLLAIHDLGLARRYADRLIIMSDRRIVADGKPDDLLAGPAIREVFGVRWSSGSWDLAS